MIVSLERIIVLYDIMMKELIEKKGSWPSTKNPLSPADALEILAGHIEKSTDYTKDNILNSLNAIFEQGAITYTNTDGQAQWTWAD